MCAKCPKGPPPKLVMLNEWADIRFGDQWPTEFNTIRADNRRLNTVEGEAPDQHVALWYVHGEPVMGRIWNNGGKVSCCSGLWFWTLV